MQRQFVVLAFFFAAFPGLQAAGQAGSPGPQQLSIPAARPAATPSLDEIVASMERAASENPARSEPYVLVRQYRFFPGGEAGQAPGSEVTAAVSFTPPNVKSFEILEAHGSGHGTSVVRHMLENEVELARDVSRSEISRRNYSFALLGTGTLDGRACYVLSLAPRREEHELLRGRVYVDAGSYHILKLEGQPERSPSWWLRSSYIVMRFGEAGGLWLPVATEGTGEVRIFGRFTLDSEKVSLRAGTQLAQAHGAAHEGKRTRALGAVLPRP
ncbi:MAG: hypothetical protein JO041_15805 [Acidobacteria bacterium]|nr:hypothetical protein [Acidobacteriota bacterium]